jgi:hypothetical protein
MQIDFGSVLNTLKTGIIKLAQTSLKDYVAQATQDGQAILDELKGNLQTWAQALADGKLSKEDFGDLLLGQKDLLEMVALKQAGLAVIQADQFKNDVMNLIKTTITGLIP